MIFSCLFDICVSYLRLIPEHISFVPNVVPPPVSPVSANGTAIFPMTQVQKLRAGFETSCSPPLNAKMCTSMYTHAHTLQCLLTLVNSLSRGPWNPCLRPVPHGTDLIQLLLSQSFSEYLPRVCVPGIMKGTGVTVSKARVLLESCSESSAVGGGFR